MSAPPTPYDLPTMFVYTYSYEKTRRDAGTWPLRESPAEYQVWLRENDEVRKMMAHLHRLSLCRFRPIEAETPLVTSWDSELIYNTNRGDVRRAVGKRIAMMPIVVCHNTHLRHLFFSRFASETQNLHPRLQFSEPSWSSTWWSDSDGPVWLS